MIEFLPFSLDAMMVKGDNMSGTRSSSRFSEEERRPLSCKFEICQLRRVVDDERKAEKRVTPKH